MAEGSQAIEAARLLTPEAVRERAHQMLRLAEADQLAHFALRPEALPAAIDYVLATIRANYPDLAVPFHSRWRHFAVGGRDRWVALERELGALPREEIARIRFDLAVTSVLLDAGAGPQWRYREGGADYSRSEGLAVASFDLFRAGLLSDDPRQKARADAAALARLDTSALAAAMQVSPQNPLVGLEGRALLLRRLGAALAEAPSLFGSPGRIGNLFDHLVGKAVAGRLPARAILIALLEGFGPIWPGRYKLGGVALGDIWHHGRIDADPAGHGLVPFHKLSQWLAYSLIEPLEAAGITVTDCDALTGLAEYRNGGLFLDLGVLAPRDPALSSRPLLVHEEPVVEWRALTVALLDRVAEGVRQRLGMDAATLPLGKVLEGGTWAAGRRIAAEKRPGGGPPLTIQSDGTVF